MEDVCRALLVFTETGETRWPLYTGASVASVTTPVFGHFNCHHTWKHITAGDEMLVLENSTQ